MVFHDWGWGAMGLCTVAYITWLLGYMPPPHSTLTIPKEYANKYTPEQQRFAHRCAARYKLTLQVAS
jgi:hypothetical protein